MVVKNLRENNRVVINAKNKKWLSIMVGEINNAKKHVLKT